jgi:hypothetical protein
MPLDSTFNEYDFLQGITDSPTLTITPANNGTAGFGTGQHVQDW